MVKFEGKAEEKELGGGSAQEAQRNKELQSAGRGSVGVRLHTDRCLRCESLLGSEHRRDALLYPGGDGVTDAP